MEERGTTEDEIRATVERGEQFPAKLAGQAFDATLLLVAYGVASDTAQSRSKSMPLKRETTGW
jgi:hypothetical protein